MATEIRVPTLGESVSEATVGTWFKKVGDAIKADEPIVELETDKVTIEVPAPAAGTLSEIVAQAGETVGLGALLGQIAEGAGAAAAAPVAAEKKPEPVAAAPAAAARPPTAAAPQTSTSMPPAPAAAKLIAENSLSA
ncbi:dihydrolipoamide succinyltransferase, partial [Sinorhizobium medicae]|uniref:biotin/lipoyl-containing protein n=1 Tax=Sinorhizobium medicae TaxID=110321 RepID=UPI001EBF7D21